MSDENENGRNNPGAPGGRAPLTLKPRAGAVSSGTVKQSFSHGRSKTVVVETKRRRVDGPPVPAATGARPVFEAPKPRAPEPAPQAPRPAPAPSPSSSTANLNLSAEELRARQRVLEAARESGFR